MSGLHPTGGDSECLQGPRMEVNKIIRICVGARLCILKISCGYPIVGRQS